MNSENNNQNLNNFESNLNINNMENPNQPVTPNNNFNNSINNSLNNNLHSNPTNSFNNNLNSDLNTNFDNGQTNDTVGNNSPSLEPINNEVNLPQNNNDLPKINTSNDEKIISNLKIDMLVLGIIYLITTVAGLFIDGFEIAIITSLVAVFVAYIGYDKAKNKKSSAGMYGLAFGILMVLSYGIINIILGIFVIINAVRYNKVFKDKKEKKNEWIIVPFIIVGYFLLAFVLAFLNYYGIFNKKLECTRPDNTKIEYRFNEEGVSKVLINGKEDKIETSLANLRFLSDFFYIKNGSSNNHIEDYLKTVKENEETELNSICK